MQIKLLFIIYVCMCEMRVHLVLHLEFFVYFGLSVIIIEIMFKIKNFFNFKWV
jgi:hypothetical protein